MRDLVKYWNSLKSIATNLISKQCCRMSYSDIKGVNGLIMYLHTLGNNHIYFAGFIYYLFYGYIFNADTTYFWGIKIACVQKSNIRYDIENPCGSQPTWLWHLKLDVKSECESLFYCRHIYTDTHKILTSHTCIQVIMPFNISDD